MFPLDSFRRLPRPATDDLRAPPATSAEPEATGVLVAKAAKRGLDLVKPRVPSFIASRVVKNVRWAETTRLGSAAALLGTTALSGVDGFRYCARFAPFGTRIEQKLVNVLLYLISAAPPASTSNAPSEAGVLATSDPALSSVFANSSPTSSPAPSHDATSPDSM